MKLQDLQSLNVVETYDAVDNPQGRSSGGDSGEWESALGSFSDC
ncbi:hypothetical protein [Segetibacter koreensis]|nr:hypothetical protein [Segetibacter koreensis]